MMTRIGKTLIVSTLAAALPGTAAFADEVYVKSGNQGAALEYKDATISSLKAGELYYSTNGRESHRPVAEVNRIVLTGETQLNAAETAFAAAKADKNEASAKAKYSEAVTGYQATLASTNKPWLKDFVALRLQVAAPLSGRFDAAVASWKQMVEKDPVAALKSKPSVDGIDPKSAYLANAAKELASSAASSSKVEAKRAFYTLLSDVQDAMGDKDASAKTAETLVGLGGTPEEVAELGVRLAMLDLSNKKYDAASARLGKLDMNILNDSSRADALFIQAEIKSEKVGPTAPPDELKELAIEYMKVIAGFPTSQHAGAALLKVAEIHETLKENETALKIYKQVAREQANSPAGQAAAKSVERLSKAG